MMDSGMATSGMMTERSEPRKTNTTAVTMRMASSRVLTTSSMEALTNLVES
ncbi:hypothetical protein GALL_268590 [mine drainage metagenome]|uniref:Uncharacterized protein n=1 Tax=mine drainage metagenome TaxID=410659 RepID=A0A1J5R5N2_9ZZZZ